MSSANHKLQSGRPRCKLLHYQQIGHPMTAAEVSKSPALPFQECMLNSTGDNGHPCHTPPAT